MSEDAVVNESEVGTPVVDTETTDEGKTDEKDSQNLQSYSSVDSEKF